MSRHYKAIAAYYDAEHADYDYLSCDVPFFIHHLPRKRQRVLEVAVGTARAAIPIALAGHRVVGFDNDPGVLKIAAERRAECGLGDKQLELHDADALDFQFHGRFDYAAIFFNTFLLFTSSQEQDRVLSRIAGHLKPGGRLWLDMFQPNLELIAKESATGLDARLFYVPSLHRTVLRQTDLRCDPARQVQRVTNRYEWFDERGSARRARVRFELAILFPRELKLVLERNGFEIEHLYGDYNANPLDADSERMIVCAGKKACHR